MIKVETCDEDKNKLWIQREQVIKHVITSWTGYEQVMNKEKGAVHKLRHPNWG